MPRTVLQNENSLFKANSHHCFVIHDTFACYNPLHFALQRQLELLSRLVLIQLLESACIDFTSAHCLHELVP